MKERPSFWNFILNNILWIKKYFVYKNKKTGKSYKEKHAYRNRRNTAYVVCVLPMIKSALYRYALSDNWSNGYHFMDVVAIIVVIIAFLLRYFFIDFIEIDTREEASDTRIKGFEYLLFLLWIIIVIEVNGGIFIDIDFG